MTRVLNKIWKGKGIYKIGNKRDTKNYRPVTLMDTGYKLYAEILRARMAKKLEREGNLGETQMGFRERKGTIDAVYLLKTVLRKKLRGEGRKMATEQGTAYAYFSDLKAAFNKVERKDIVGMMKSWGWRRN